MKKTLIAFVLALAALPLQAKTIKMEVNGLVCAFCAQGIDKKLRTFAPTRDVFVSLEKRLVAVALKDGQDIPDATLTASLKESGYDVVGIARVDDTLDKVRAEAKRK
jgi:mercuric ion binding protein